MHQKRRGAGRSAEETDVSVIVPVHDAVEYLPALLRSMDEQGLGRRMDLILVDDGSTDGSGALLDDYASTSSSVTVIHQENSGWPGQPRNRGLDLAHGRWIFFADADDYLAPGALRELIDFGDAQESLVVIPRVSRTGTRSDTGRAFTETVVDARKKVAFRTFTPHKLIRRDLIETHRLRFPEGMVRLEDGIMISRAYLLADRISILAERDYYFYRGRDDGQNISAQRIVPESYVASVQRIAENVLELSRGPKMTRALIAELTRRKILKVYAPERFPRYSRAIQQRWIDAHRPYLDGYVDAAVHSALSERNQAVCDLVRAGDLDALLDHLTATSVDPSTDQPVD
jgi:glycosyltransferase involved in cell wall biosynthesis